MKNSNISYSSRLIDRRLLHLTEKSFISKPGARCIDRAGYNPDKEIMKLITKKINCSLPWSKLETEGFNECKSEDDFERYLLAIVDSQSEIRQVPKKCKYKTWTPLKNSDRSSESEKSEVIFELALIDSKVRNTN